jgi:hypothetical protein
MAGPATTSGPPTHGLRVIGAGLGRTGTVSLKSALEQLGFGPCYHMLELIAHPERAAHWQTALDGNDVDWDVVYRGYSSTVDWPGAAFYRELAARYPDAKVVLSLRDPDSWYESTLKTTFAARQAAARGKAVATAAPEVSRLTNELIWQGTFRGRFLDRALAIEAFNRHNEMVIETIPAERLLVHEIAEGWKPLARFLGVEPPDGEFPRLNDAATFRSVVGMPAL